MEFIVTNHAKLRMIQRDIPEPNKLILKCARKKTRKKIRELCIKNGVKNEIDGYVYFVNDKFVYVCIILDIAKYKVITAFKLN